MQADTLLEMIWVKILNRSSSACILHRLPQNQHEASQPLHPNPAHGKNKWVVVKIMVPFWIPIIIRHLIFRVPKKDLNFGIPPNIYSEAVCSAGAPGFREPKAPASLALPACV